MSESTCNGDYLVAWYSFRTAGLCASNIALARYESRTSAMNFCRKQDGVMLDEKYGMLCLPRQSNVMTPATASLVSHLYKMYSGGEE